MDLSGYSDDQLKAMLDAPPAVMAPAQAASAAPAAAPDLSHLSDDQLQAMLPPGDAKPLTVHGTPIDHGATASGMAGFLDGIPVVGPKLLDLSADTGAAIATLRDGGTYADQRAKIQQNLDATRAAHPYAGTAGSIAGGVVGTAPLVAMAPEAFGVGTGSLGLRAATGALTGSALGGADAGVRSGGDVVSTGAGAGIGALGGALGPAVGAGAGAVARRFLGQAVNEAEGVPAAARQYLVDKLQADNPAAVMDNMRALGDQAMLADYGPGLRGIAQGLATKPGPGQQAVMAPLTIRNAGTNARLDAAVNGALGPDQSPLAYKQAIEAAMEAPAAAQGAAIRNAPMVDVQHILDHIDAQLPGAKTASVANGSPEHNALTTARNMLSQQNPAGSVVPSPLGTMPAADSGPITNARQLLSARRALDDLIDYNGPSLTPQSSAVKDQQGVLQTTRGMINDALRTQVPGYADATDELAGLARRAKAVEDGTKTLNIRPDDLAAQYGKLGEVVRPNGAVYPSAQPDFAVGQRSLIGKAFGTKENDLQALRNFMQGEQGWNLQNTATIHGQDAASTLADAARQNIAYRDTFNKVTQNSESARNLAAAKGLADADVTPFQIGSTRDVTGTGAALSTLKVPVNWLLRALTKPVDNSARDLGLAKIITAQGDERNRLLAQALRAHAAEVANTQMAANQARTFGSAAALVTPAVAPSVLAKALKSGRR